MKSYKRGTLIWIDDDFEHDDLMGEGGDVDAWQRTFGNIDSRIYRLLDLNLEIATNYTDAINLLDELTAPEYGDAVIFGILDMRIPQCQDGGSAKKKYGLDCAKAFSDKGIDFAVLSSKADAQKELVTIGLENTKYYKKLPAPSKTMMPEDLARLVLSRFKNHLNWIDLEPIFKSWNADRKFRHPLSARKPEFNNFPFFGPCRDFVERWEGRQATLWASKGSRIVMRAPETHSDEFVCQCLSIVISGQFPSMPVDVMFTYAYSEEALAVCKVKSESPVRIVRIKGDNDAQIEREKQVIRDLLSSFPSDQIILVLPLDERADPFLTMMSLEDDVVFDDLPAVRINDVIEREALVRRIAEFQIQNVRIAVDGQSECLVNEFYLDHPEMLFHPLYWTFLLESQQVAETLTDPLEMLMAISAEVGRIASWPSAMRQALIDGDPIDIEYLFRPGEETFRELVHTHSEWVIVSFRDWLSKSWCTPYGCIDIEREKLRQDYRVSWEWQSLLICKELSETFLALPDEVKGKEGVLLQAARFLSAPAISKIIEQKSVVSEWLGLEALRWPHTNCPMPSALNRRLKEEGRYLFVQTDVLDQATLTRTGTRYLLRLEEYAEMQGDRIASLRNNVPHLPKGWKEPIAEIIEFVENREGGRAITSPLASSDTEKIWPALLSLAKNATRVSYIYHTFRAHDDRLTRSDIDTLVGRNGKTGGEGPLLGAIRNRRLDHSDGTNRKSLPRSRNFARELMTLRLHSSALVRFAAHKNHNARSELMDGLSALLNQFSKLKVTYSEESSLDDLAALMDQVEGNMWNNVVDKDAALHSNEFYDNTFALGGELEKMPLASGALRGTRLDLMMAMFDWAEYAVPSLRHLQYADGFHFLAMVRDQRNTEKDHRPVISEATLWSIIELFLAGAEGLLFQLRTCLELTGHRDVAHRITLDTADDIDENDDAALPEGAATLGDVMVVRIDDADDGYEVFTKGAPGAQSAAFSYTSLDLSMHVHEEAGHA